MKRITAKQEAFAQAIVDGKGPSQAHNLAYRSKGSPKRVSIMAQAVLNHPAVVARVTELRNRITTSKTLERTEKRELIARILREEKTAQGQAVGPGDMRAFLEVDNKMAGHNAAEEIKVEANWDAWLEKIRKDAPKP